MKTLMDTKLHTGLLCWSSGFLLSLLIGFLYFNSAAFYHIPLKKEREISFLPKHCDLSRNLTFPFHSDRKQRNS